MKDFDRFKNNKLKLGFIEFLNLKWTFNSKCYPKQTSTFYINLPQ